MSEDREAGLKEIFREVMAVERDGVAYVLLPSLLTQPLTSDLGPK